MHKCNVDFYSDVKNQLYKQVATYFHKTDRISVSLYLNALVLFVSKQEFGFLDKVFIELEKILEFENRGFINERKEK